MKDEFTAAMHSEFRISRRKEICLTAGCVWEIVSWDAPEEEIKKIAKTYNLTYKQAMGWKEYWMRLIKKSPEDYVLGKCERALKKVYKNYREERDSIRFEYNVFAAIGISADEVKHSAFLASLMKYRNTDTNYNLSSEYLGLFINQSKTLADFGIDPIRAEVRTEVPIGDKTPDGGGRIDILITYKDKAIIIENKIYAQDQPNQLVRYHAFGKKNFPGGFALLYLTLNGVLPSVSSREKLEVGKDYYCISYQKYITQWLNKCLESITVNRPTLYYSVVQYLDNIKKLTMRQEFINILCNKTNARDLSIILDNKASLEAKLIDSYLVERLATAYADKDLYDMEIEKYPKFHNNLLLAFRPKHWKGMGLWHVIQRCGANGAYGICVDKREMKPGTLKKAQLRSLLDGNNDMFPFGWKNIFLSFERIVEMRPIEEICQAVTSAMEEIVDENNIDLGTYRRDTIQAYVDRCQWQISQYGEREHIVRNECGLSNEEFDYFVECQRFMSVELPWGENGEKHAYMLLPKYVYWTKEDAIEETTIINRMKWNLDESMK